MTDREVMKQALEAYDKHEPLAVVMEELRTALEQPDRQTLQAAGTHPAPCARHCEAKAFELEIRSLKSALRAALEQQAEPVAWWHKKSDTFTSGSLISHFTEWLPLYTHPPQRKLLTGEQIEFAWMKAMQSTPGTTLPIHEFARALEQAHDIKETP